jgi:predicted esterase
MSFMATNPALGFVHRFVPAPGEPPSRLTLLLLHGTGGDESDLLDLGRTLSPGAALLSPRGRVLEHGAPRFFRRLAEGVFDLPDLHAQTAALAAFVGAAAAEYGFDPTDVVAVGFSNGANIAASLLLSHPGVLAGAVLLRPMVPFEPAVKLDLGGVPVLIAAGLRDPIVPAAQTQRLADLLRGGGADVTVAEQPAGHGLVAGDVTAAREWVGDFERRRGVA